MENKISFWLITVLGLILVATLATTLVSNQATAKTDRYCEDYAVTTLYNATGDYCVEPTNATNNASIVPNETFNTYSNLIMYAILGAIISIIIAKFLNDI